MEMRDCAYVFVEQPADVYLYPVSHRQHTYLFKEYISLTFKA